MFTHFVNHILVTENISVDNPDVGNLESQDSLIPGVPNPRSPEFQDSDDFSKSFSRLGNFENFRFSGIQNIVDFCPNTVDFGHCRLHS